MRGIITADRGIIKRRGRIWVAHTRVIFRVKEMAVVSNINFIILRSLKF